MLSQNEYVRERTQPRHGDQHYIPLSDLLIALKQLLPDDRSKTLDYGAGGSPYRGIVGGAYVRADISENDDPSTPLDYQLDENGRLPAHLSEFDLVLSTQVLEHVQDPPGYLKECWRVLKPGGHLIVTTHGSFEDHPCPDDLWRWTADGLSELVRREGFETLKVLKLTAGPRAVLYLHQRERHNFWGLKRSLRIGWTIAPYVMVPTSKLAKLHRDCDVMFPNFRCEEASASPSRIYIGLALLARKLAA